MALLPDVSDAAAYRAVFRDAATWMPAIDAIAARHGLDGGSLARAPDGGNVVWLAGSRVIKLFAPLYAGEHAAERGWLDQVAGRVRVGTPEVVADGELEGWPYLILTRVGGVPLTRVYATLDAAARIRVAEQLGALAATLHEIPIRPADDAWDATYADLRASAP